VTNLPEDEAREPAIWPADVTASREPVSTRASGEEQPTETSPNESALEEPALAAPPSLGPDSFFVSYAQPGAPVLSPHNAGLELFQSFAQPAARTPVRIPNFVHLILLALLLGAGLIGTGVTFFLASLFLHIGLNQITHAAATSVPLMLGSEAVLYFITFSLSFLIFPFIWHEKFFAGLQWRGAVARKRFWVLAATALGCAGLAALDEVLLPGPSNAPIDKMFSSPGAAWLMFAFGTTIAPFFEEMAFRGFLLPALCTAWDWTAERITHQSAPPLDGNGHPQWSIPAMAVASVLTSIPFALLHVDQQGHSLGPFLLLIAVSLVLCTVRLKTRSLAASTLVHACYNFIIFSLALIGTSGFRHFDKM
jgi:uncharacterized protein